ncbi:fructose bisphosphate aldolase [Candidatus Saccharibacteria bacterium]|nr:fructose bisphosphate aldolase [Candidatus Saccharibacteria bacterium]
MNLEQLNRMKSGKGFVAALDQSGGSTTNALAGYGVDDTRYDNQKQMFDLIHEMRTRIISNPSFDGDRILGAILFSETMFSKIEDLYTADYLWQKKHIVPFLKVDNGLENTVDGVQLMKPITELDGLLDAAKKFNIFGTKMRSVIKEYNEDSIKKLVDQQFELAKIICEAGLVPILEPEVDINSPEKETIEIHLRDLLVEGLNNLTDNQLVMLKLTIPEQKDFYSSLMSYEKVVRVVALSGGYSQAEANQRLLNQQNLIASFSRALAEGLNVDQTYEEFTKNLESNVNSIYIASTQK